MKNIASSRDCALGSIDSYFENDKNQKYSKHVQVHDDTNVMYLFHGCSREYILAVE